MFDKWLNLPAHFYLRITAFTIMVIGVAVSNVLMSIGAIWLLSNWVIEGKFREYAENFKKNPLSWILLAYFLYSLLTLLWSDDLSYGVKDLRVKLPVFIIPLVMTSSRPIKTSVFYYLLYVFIGIILLTSLINYFWYHQFCEDPNDIRKMSIFISHVRFSTLVTLAVFTLVYLGYKRKLALYLVIPVALWLLYYTYVAQVLTGYVMLVILTWSSVLFFIRKIPTPLTRRVTLGLFLFLSISGSFVMVKQLSKYSKEPVQFEELERYTVNGNPYYHDTTNLFRENGHYVWLYVSREEMEPEWNKRSVIAYDSTDRKGQPMFGTLMRYLTSRDLRKDSAGVAALSDKEIQLIENGHTSIVMNSSGFREKLSAFMEEYSIYKSGGDPNGHSLLQRMEHMRIAGGIIYENWFLGVGVGDVNQAFERKYEELNTLLLPENRHRSHNQFLTTWIALGLPGLFIFISLLLYPTFSQKKPDYFLSIVTLSLVVSCFFQDMIETQAGATIFGLFYAIAVFREKDE